MTLTQTDYQYVRELLLEASAISLDSDKEYLVRARLTPMMHQQGLTTLSELIALVRAGSPKLRMEVVEAMTTNETSFFRDVRPFDALRRDVVPELLETGSRQLRFWSAAAATGQEAYSLAILMRDHFPLEPTPVTLATDISTAALAQGRQGYYSQQEVNRGLPIQSLVRHFEQIGRGWQVGEELRRQVQWRQLNLAAPWPPLPPMDLILLRNVLIYFEPEMRADILLRASRVLRPGGFLLLGTTESSVWPNPDLERVTIDRTLFFRKSTAGRPG
ncbi:MAG: chemotaxis protein methyltransferase CheR [Actinomycetota bacterium]|jgi:chemotaxis protein methyltransferase CheR|nr:chemotaxis protein methyltransferase CheR [Actinomycetota bacterium]HQZ85758.1 protein-glutamate O-methyltransferase CheR [Actinomycetota bacterium]